MSTDLIPINPLSSLEGIYRSWSTLQIAREAGLTRRHLSDNEVQVARLARDITAINAIAPVAERLASRVDYGEVSIDGEARWKITWSGWNPRR